MTKIGILSDTHLTSITPQFQILASRAFSQCDTIIHAGDMTNTVILDVFQGKTVHAVHGNMCTQSSVMHNPLKKIIQVDDITIGLCHGAGARHNIEERMWALFPEADCIIYGHTHHPVCEKKGGVLFINPGSFQCSGPYGSAASYAILEISEQKMDATLHTITADK